MRGAGEEPAPAGCVIGATPVPAHHPTPPVVSNAQIWIARLLWFAPALLLFLTVNQAMVAVDLRETLEAGRPAVAEVTDYEKVDRADVTFDYVSLRVPLENGEVLVREKMSLPHSLSLAIEGKTSLDVRVLPGAAQPVVITEVAATQWRIAAMNAAISFGAFLMFVVGLAFWQRYLRRERHRADADVAGPAQA